MTVAAFTRRRPSRRPQRLGLLGIRERLSLVSGVLEVEIGPGRRLHAVRARAVVSATVRVFVADDHPVVLAGIKALLTRRPGIEIIGEALDGRVRAADARSNTARRAVLDLSMPGLSGMDVVRQLLAACPECKVLVLTVHEDRSYVRKLLEFGAVGYVLKRSAPEDLLRAIHAVAARGHLPGPGDCRAGDR